MGPIKASAIFGLFTAASIGFSGAANAIAIAIEEVNQAVSHNEDTELIAKKKGRSSKGKSSKNKTKNQDDSFISKDRSKKKRKHRKGSDDHGHEHGSGHDHGSEHEHEMEHGPEHEMEHEMEHGAEHDMRHSSGKHR